MAYILLAVQYACCVLQACNVPCASSPWIHAPCGCVMKRLPCMQSCKQSIWPLRLPNQSRLSFLIFLSCMLGCIHTGLYTTKGPKSKPLNFTRTSGVKGLAKFIIQPVNFNKLRKQNRIKNSETINARIAFLPACRGVF